nr:transglycosylase SLT domain-containing protein [Bacilli bacterium]
MKRLWRILGVSLISFMLLLGQTTYADTSISSVQAAYAHVKQIVSQMGQQLTQLETQNTQEESRYQQLHHLTLLAIAKEQRLLLSVSRLKHKIMLDQKRIVRSRKTVDDAKKRLQQQLVFWYEKGTEPYFSVLLGATTLSDLWNRVSDLSLITQKQQVVMRHDQRIVLAFEQLLQKDRQDNVRLDRLLILSKEDRNAIAQKTNQAATVVAKLSSLKQSVQASRAKEFQTMQQLASKLSAMIEQQRLALERAAALKAAEQKNQTKSNTTPSTSSTVTTPSTINGVLTEAITITGVPSSWMNDLQILMMAESGGRPNAISPLYVDGEQATGLFQMLPSTFERYAMAGHTNIWNPLDNAIAAIHYILQEYKAPWNIPGIGTSSYQGY